MQFQVLKCRQRKTCSLPCKKRYLSQQVKGKTGGWRPKKKYNYKNYKLDSWWEVACARRLDELKLNWEPTSDLRYFQYVDLSGIIRKYHPDFYLKDHDLYIEIKGAWTPEVIHKMKDVQERNNFNLVIIDKYDDIINFVV